MTSVLPTITPVPSRPSPNFSSPIWVGEDVVGYNLSLCPHTTSVKHDRPLSDDDLKVLKTFDCSVSSSFRWYYPHKYGVFRRL